jgi:hemoglobin/transferrin/lactoferrin receptor protein
MRSVLAFLVFSVLTPAFAERLTGTVHDESGSPISGAIVYLVPSRSGLGLAPVLSQTRTDANGRFVFDQNFFESLRIRVESPGFAARELTAAASPLDVQLQPASLYSSVTVAENLTARVPEETVDLAQLAIIRTKDKLAEQPLPTLGHALAHEPGVLLQQSTYAQVSPFLRGLTGYQVLNLMDGIRFNNSTFRSGPNQYLAYVEPMQAQRVEALLGPSGTAWGSDSLGGTIHVLTTQPSFSSSGREMHGNVQLGAASADLSSNASGQLSLSTERFFLLGGLSGRLHNDLRPGSGVDSRNVFRRFFNLDNSTIRDLIGNRQQDSGFRQYGAEARFAMRLRPDQILTVNYQRGVQDNVRAYKDLLGGLGRVISTFEPQELNWAYLRYEKFGLGALDSLSGTFSFNGQTDGGRRQNLSFSDPLTTDFARVNVFGYTGQAALHRGTRLLASFGGEIYDEHIDSTREVRNPVSGVVTRPRPLYPDNARYQNYGVFAQGSYQLTSALRAAAGVRFTGIRFATQENRAFQIPESSQWYRDVTFNSSLQWQLTSNLALHGVVSRGFRAPNLNDLGALGLNDLGFEIPAADVLSSGALVAVDASEGALSSGRQVSSLSAESLMNYEFGVKFRARRFYGRAQLFDAELYDPIVRRTLLFPADRVPSTLAGLAVTPITPTAAQRQQGVVTVATANDPRAVKAFVNDGRSRYYGVETLGRISLTTAISLEGNFSYIVGRDLNPNRNIRRLPPAMGALRLRYAPSGRRPWAELAMTAAGAQTRLSGGDRDDERIGASFRRSDIASFFRGSRAAEFIDSATGIFRPTGETLAQLQNRVLPIGATLNGVRIMDDNSRVPLYTSTAGWAVFHIRSGIPMGERWELNSAIENVLDQNYRYHGSGVDAPGFNAWVGLRFVF